MIHAALRRVGPILGGPDSLIDALRDAVGPAGTILAYTDWEADYERLADAGGRVPARWRDEIPPFDPARSRAARDNGAFAELVRTTPGARRSGNPGASVTALGAEADRLTRDHPLDYGYGPGTPFARLVASGAKVLMLGAPTDTMTLLHHAEHLAALPDKRVKRIEVPLLSGATRIWRMIEEFDTSDPVTPALPQDAFARIVADYVAGGGAAREAHIGRAPSLLVPAAAIVPFAVAWMEAHVRAEAGREEERQGGAA